MKNACFEEVLEISDLYPPSIGCCDWIVDLQRGDCNKLIIQPIKSVPNFGRYYLRTRSKEFSDYLSLPRS
jgi:hypothetical protein